MVLYLVKDKRMVLQERPEYCNTATMLVMVEKLLSNDHIYIHMGRYSPQWHLPLVATSFTLRKKYDTRIDIPRKRSRFGFM